MGGCIICTVFINNLVSVILVTCWEKFAPNFVTCEKEQVFVNVGFGGGVFGIA